MVQSGKPRQNFHPLARYSSTRFASHTALKIFLSKVKMSPPPSLPPDSVYTSCYCEENIYLLCRALLQTPSVTELWDIFVVFISNANKAVGIRLWPSPLVMRVFIDITLFTQVALWYQKTARSPDYPVVWDYHVILVLRPRRKEHTKETGHPEMHSWVYDFDTTLGLPHPWEGTQDNGCVALPRS